MPPTVEWISLFVPSGIWTERNANTMLPFLFIHPAERGFLDRSGDSGPGGIEQLMIRLVVRLRNNGLDLRARRGRTGVDWGREVKVEIVARLRTRRIRVSHRADFRGRENEMLRRPNARAINGRHVRKSLTAR